ncbi:uncharacterized protein LOC135946953 [Cloeon dipterum]|uniref:uncharacterized protein LOC135946953 n=1 Tax=Cloeon dipterum TaxID=197152 RepID=UPI00321F81C9
MDPTDCEQQREKSFVSEMNDLSNDEVNQRLDELGSDLSECYDPDELEEYLLGDVPLTPPKPMKHKAGESAKEMMVLKNWRAYDGNDVFLNAINTVIIGAGYSVVEFAESAVKLGMVSDEEEEFYSDNELATVSVSFDSTKSRDLPYLPHPSSLDGFEEKLFEDEEPDSSQELFISDDNQDTLSVNSKAAEFVNEVLTEAMETLAASVKPDVNNAQKENKELVTKAAENDCLDDFLLIESDLIEQMRGLVMQLKTVDTKSKIEGESTDLDKGCILEQMSALVEKLPNKDSRDYCLSLRRKLGRANKCPYTEEDIASLQLSYQESALKPMLEV